MCFSVWSWRVIQWRESWCLHVQGFRGGGRVPTTSGTPQRQSPQRLYRCLFRLEHPPPEGPSPDWTGHLPLGKTRLFCARCVTTSLSLSLSLSLSGDELISQSGADAVLVGRPRQFFLINFNSKFSSKYFIVCCNHSN